MVPIYTFKFKRRNNDGGAMTDGFVARSPADEIIFSAVKKTLDSRRMQSIIRIIFPAF